jgi:signal peptidase II
MIRKSTIYYPVAAIWVAADILTKRWVVPFLTESGGARDIVGNYVRFTLAMNKGMAFGLSFGEWSRWILIAFTLVTLALVLHLYRQTADNHKIQVFALALITGGAIGNLLDRLASGAGVVDFIDVGIGTHRFWIFNVADAGVSVGGALLVLTLWITSERAKKVEEATTATQT